MMIGVVRTCASWLISSSLARVSSVRWMRVFVFTVSPLVLSVTNGSEFTNWAILKWANENDVEWHYFDLGKPQQNAFIGSFNGNLSDELLNKNGSTA